MLQMIFLVKTGGMAWRSVQRSIVGTRVRRGVAPTSDAAARARGTCGPMGRSGALWSRGCPIVSPTTQAIALELDAVGVVNDAVQYGVAECGIGNHVMPLRHGDLTCDQQRSLVVAIIDDLE
ncbi:hypothetical protein AOQ71_17255 [Bradyrhizobium manausense]|uniref:Uncharacterized protein n=1 Tax=Bradyrhizobium manausense TaxID=989370 RepID=A0A0R3DQ69_9BRAD|nr:hypothetical protein AOQ71_17255 [Bradyrhizobium manausense]